MIPRLAIAQVLAPSRPAGGDDRVAVFPHARGTTLVIADGAGGTGRGGQAADRLVDFLRDLLRADRGIEDPVVTLHAADEEIRQRAGGGETTGNVLTFDATGIHGASVGDSEAWMIGDHVVTLTEGQWRKPLLGSGEATPIRFAVPSLDGTLVLASDGLWKYAGASTIAAAVRGLAPEAAAAALVALVRFPNGRLQDDVAVIVATAIG